MSKNSYESFRGDVIAGIVIAIIAIIVVYNVIISKVPKIIAGLIDLLIGLVLIILAIILAVVLIIVLYRLSVYFYRLNTPKRCRRKIARLSKRSSKLEAKISTSKQTILELHPHYKPAANARLQELVRDQEKEKAQIQIIAVEWRDYKANQLDRVYISREKKIKKMIDKPKSNQISQKLSGIDEKAFTLEEEIKQIESAYGIVSRPRS